MAEKRQYKDRAKYIINAVAKRRKALRIKAIEYLGGQCSKCGYKKYGGALEFHHLDNHKKDFGLSANGITRSWERTKKELSKCILLCANCHRELHGQKMQPSVRKSEVKTR